MTGKNSVKPDLLIKKAGNLHSKRSGNINLETYGP
jgi:hypothetical protein